jgi:pyruvate carboxylase
VARGDILVTLEAMKMQTAVRAESDGIVDEVLAKPGQTVEVKDLLLVLRQGAGAA